MMVICATGQQTTYMSSVRISASAMIAWKANKDNVQFKLFIALMFSWAKFQQILTKNIILLGEQFFLSEYIQDKY